MLFRLNFAMKIASNVQIRVSQMVLLLILNELVFDKVNVSAYFKPFAKALYGFSGIYIIHSLVGWVK